MKKLLVLGFICTLSMAQSAQYGLEFESGMREDELFWNIGNARYLAPDDNVYTPNILSELQWDDMQSAYGKIALHGKEGPYRLRLFYLRSMDAHSGDNQDSDYLYDNRQGEFSRSNNSAKDSWFEQYGIRIGDSYDINPSWNMVVWAGYEVDKQNLRMSKGYQTRDPYGWFGGTGVIAGLESTFDTTWKGPLAGLSFAYDSDMFALEAGGYYHWLQYEGKGYWNLRDMDIDQLADDAYGVEYFAKLSYQYSEALSFFVHYDYRKNRAKDGTTQNEGSAKIRLNEVESKSQKIGIGLAYWF